MSKLNHITHQKLSVEECRRLLCVNGKSFTDDEVIAIRDFLYQLAEIDFEVYQQTRNTEDDELNQAA